MTQRPTVLVLGARGRFGLAATRAFAQAGWQVHAQVRPGAAGPNIPGVEWIAARPEDTSALVAAANGASVVVQGLSPAYTHQAWREHLPALTQAAIDVTRELGGTLMLPASVYNFGEGMPSVLREDTPQTPTTFKGRMRVASEEQVRAATLDGCMQAVVVRSGDFYGGGTGSWFDLVMAKDLASGKFTYPGRYDVATAWAYMPDLARAFVKVAEQRGRLLAFDTLHFAGEVHSGQDWAHVMEALAQEQQWLREGQPLRTASISWLLVRLAGFVMPTMASIFEMRYLWRKPYALDNRKLVALIGEEPRTPFAQAVRASLGDLGLLSAAGGVTHARPASAH